MCPIFFFFVFLSSVLNEHREEKKEHVQQQNANDYKLEKWKIKRGKVIWRKKLKLHEK